MLIFDDVAILKIFVNIAFVITIYTMFVIMEMTFKVIQRHRKVHLT